MHVPGLLPFEDELALVFVFLINNRLLATADDLADTRLALTPVVLVLVEAPPLRRVGNLDQETGNSKLVLLAKLHDFGGTHIGELSVLVGAELDAHLGLRHPLKVHVLLQLAGFVDVAPVSAVPVIALPLHGGPRAGIRVQPLVGLLAELVIQHRTHPGQVVPRCHVGQLFFKRRGLVLTVVHPRELQALAARHLALLVRVHPVHALAGLAPRPLPAGRRVVLQRDR
mmetsp:Transcript_37177/g.83965  ORF Transcript_37177/g.83965 Transcript_37177/m.83965 type:complete len:227 (+) Transcript_37177:135-815(+)